MMKKLYIWLACLGVLCLAACDSGSKEEAPASSAKTEQAQPAPAAEASVVADAGNAPQELGPPPTREQLDAADALVAFYNTAASALANPYYTQADVMMGNVRYYLHEWMLAPRPDGGDGKPLAAHLAAPQGMSTEDESRAMA